MDLQIKNFSVIDLQDEFFDSLRESYEGFDEWFMRKAAQGETAYTYYESGKLKDFLYLKIETEDLNDVNPVLPARKRLKVGTFKIDNRGTRRGERFMKKIMDKAIAEDVDEIYVTIFPEERLKPLIQSFEKFGFTHVADKMHASGNAEWVLVKDMRHHVGDYLRDYPFVAPLNKRKVVLSIKPEYHTKLFPDSILNNETYDLINDLSATNSIYKVYVSRLNRAPELKNGDLVVMYRTKDNGPARFRSVCTSVCTVMEVKTKNDFQSFDELKSYAQKYSVLTDAEINEYYSKDSFSVIKMIYNIAFTKRVTNGTMIDDLKLSPQYWGFFDLNDEQFDRLCELGKINERYIIH